MMGSRGDSMGLECRVRLPTQHSEFARGSYWNSFFQKRGRKPFEWYGEYTDLVDIFNKYIRKQDPILVPGCGNSSLSECLYDMQGCQNITSIDLSSVAIRQMSGKHKNRKGLVFEQQDATKMSFSDSSFAVIIDKGTLDSVMYAQTPECNIEGQRLLEEYNRVLKVGGRCIVISLVQDHILKMILDFFYERHNYVVRFHRCVSSEEKQLMENPEAIVMPIFAVVATKFRQTANMHILPIEVSNMTEKPKKMHGGPEQLLNEVKKYQEFAIYRQRARRTRLGAMDEMRFQIEDNNGETRYELVVVDREDESPREVRVEDKVGVFIVPQGSERLYIYNTKEGRRQLVSSAKCERLIVVFLMWSQFYDSMQEIQDELSKHVLALTGPGFVPGTKVPFLTDGDCMTGKVLCEGYSDISGRFVIQETLPPQVGTSDEQCVHVHRRLIFLSNKMLIQSEIRLRRADNPNKSQPNAQHMDMVLGEALNGTGSLDGHLRGKGDVLDFSDLACMHHVAVVGGLSFMKNKHFPGRGLEADLGLVEQDRPRVLVVGLGGGCMPMFLRNHFPCLKIDVVEIDSRMLDVAKEWFGFREDEHLRVLVEDGLDYLKAAAEQGLQERTYDAIVFDVGNTDTSAGLSCPPLEFVDKDVIMNVKKCLRKGGVFILNLASRSDSLKHGIEKRMATYFDRVFVTPIADEINDILYCIPDSTAEELVYEGTQDEGEEDKENGEQRNMLEEKEDDYGEPIHRRLERTLLSSGLGIPHLRIISAQSELERSRKFDGVLADAAKSVERVVEYMREREQSMVLPKQTEKKKRRKKHKNRAKAPPGAVENYDEDGGQVEALSKSETFSSVSLDLTVPSPLRNSTGSPDQENNAASEGVAAASLSPAGGLSPGKKSKHKHNKKKFGDVDGNGNKEVQLDLFQGLANTGVFADASVGEAAFSTKLKNIFERLGLMGRDETDMFDPYGGFG